MKYVAGLMLSGCLLMSSAVTTAQTDKISTQGEAYALYVLQHPKENSLKTTAFVENFTKDYAPLFNEHKTVDLKDYVAYESKRLEPILQQRRDISLKQAHVRFGVLDANKDGKITLKEYQEIGLKTFSHFDLNQDGLVNMEDAKLETVSKSTHDGFKVKTPLAMPMAGSVQEFIQMYAKEGKAYVTLADYLSHRDQQFFLTDTNHDLVLTEDEYVGEFTTRYDQHLKEARQQYQLIFTQLFEAMSQGKTTITQKDVQRFAKQVAAIRP